MPLPSAPVHGPHGEKMIAPEASPGLIHIRGLQLKHPVPSEDRCSILCFAIKLLLTLPRRACRHNSGLYVGAGISAAMPNV